VKKLRKILAVLLCVGLLTGCGMGDAQSPQSAGQDVAEENTNTAPAEEESAQEPEVETEEESTGAVTEEVTEESKEPEEVKEEEEVMPTKFVALTFDDGPNTNTMVEVLDILKEQDVKATFYVIGALINDSTGEVIQRAYEEGHEIGNHSQTHQDMTHMDEATLREEIDLVQNKVEELTGAKPTSFRPPYIAINQLMHDTIELPFIVGIDSRDWDPNASGQDRYNNVVKGAQDGAIFLLHCMTGNSETVKVLPAIIKELRNQGYGFVTVSELFEMQGTKYEAHDGQRFSVLPKQN